MELKEKCAYIKGLMEGLELDTTTKEGKVINAMMELLTELTSTVTALDDELDQVYDELDAIDEDMDDLEEAVYGDEDDDEDGDGLIEYECPHCGTVIFFDENAFDMEEEHLCPNCHRKVFEEDGDDGDDEK